MSSLSAFGLQTGSGILHPKMPNKFVVRFACLYDGTPELPAQRASELLHALTMQVVSTQMPGEDFTALPRNSIKLSNPAFRDFTTDGNLILTFEDDVTNLVQEALEFLSRPDVTRISILIAQLDGDEGVLEAYFFGSCKLKKITPSRLSYNGYTGSASTGSFRGTMTDTSKEKIDLQGSLNFGSDGSTVTKQLELLPLYTKRAYFKGPSAPKISELTKQILGV